MQCPVCTTTQLVMSERQGIEIDYCPQCRGVWLDRGELDKIIERSAGSQSYAAQSAPPRDERGYPSQAQHGHYQDDYQRDYRRRKKKGFLGELFDFD